MAELEQYKQLAGITLHYQPDQKKDKLQTAVRSQPNLQNIKTTHRLMNLKGHHKIDYDGYLALLRHAAQTFDSEQQKLGNPKYRLNKHTFSFDYCDHGSEMFDDLSSYDNKHNYDNQSVQYNDVQIQQNVARWDPHRV